MWKWPGHYACRRRGLTLIEVVAALTLLGVLVVGLIQAKAAHSRQLARAERKRAAVEATRAMLVDSRMKEDEEDEGHPFSWFGAP